MSLRIDWNFTGEFVDQLKRQLHSSLNDPTQKPDEIYGNIEVKDFNPGVKAPWVEILEIKELNEEEAVLLLSVHYDGDMQMTVATKAQINPLYAPDSQQDEPEQVSLRHYASSSESKPFIVPVFLSVSQIQFDAFVLVTVRLKEGAVKLKYCNDKAGLDQQDGEPYFQLEVNSTFDDVPVIRKYLQTMIEGKIRQFLTVDLLDLVYNASRESMPKVNFNQLIERALNPEDCPPHLENGLSVVVDSPNSCSHGLAACEKRGDWSFDRDDFLSACYASPEGLFVIERRFFAPFKPSPEMQQRIEQIQTDSNSSIQTNGPVMISFPFKSSMCHILSSFNTSLLFHKYGNAIFPPHSFSLPGKNSAK